MRDPERIMVNGKRPLSPHLQIYRPQLTSIMSIFHRASGLYLSLGLPVLVWGLWSMAKGEAAFDSFRSLMMGILGQLFCVLWIAAFCYHLLNGLRHLGWDAGFGFDLATVYKTGWAVLIGASLLWIAFLLVSYNIGAR